jgi:hypothetical protein
MVGSDDLLDILRSALQLGLAGGVADVIGGQQLVDQLHFALTENFLLQTPRDDLVPFCGHVSAPFRPLRRVIRFHYKDGAIHYCLAHPYPPYELCVSIGADRTTTVAVASLACAARPTARGSPDATRGLLALPYSPQPYRYFFLREA